MACSKGAGAIRSIPLTGKPRRDAWAQFHAQCRPSGSQRLRVRRYATASHAPARAVLTNVKPGTACGLFRWIAANGTEVSRTPSHARFARVSGYPLQTLTRAN